MASKIKVDQIAGSSGSTITVPTGQTLTLTDGLAVASLPTVTVAKGGTNLTSFTAGDVLYATGSTTLAKLVKGSDDDVLTLASGLPSWAASAGGGKIGQIVQDTLNTGTSTTSEGTYVSITGLVQAITPVATTSKILIMVSLAGITNSGDNGRLYFRISGGNTDTYLGYDTGGGGEQCANTWSSHRAGYNQANCNLMYLDAPATTSAVTYQVQWQVYGATGYINISNVDNTETAYAMSTITCMEVLA